LRSGRRCVHYRYYRHPFVAAYIHGDNA
jgi:hypothetical protein